MTATPPQLVSEFISPTTREWNVQKLQVHMLPMDVQAVRQIPLSFASHDDCWAWQYERSGSFSVRSAYRMLVETKMQREDWLNGAAVNSNKEEEEKNWSRLWKIMLAIILIVS